MPTNTTTSDTAARFPWSITYRHLAYFLGAISGFVWLLPVFGPPGGGIEKTDTSSLIRYLRILGPLCVFLLVRQETLWRLRRLLARQITNGIVPRPVLRLIGLILTLGLVPLAAGLFSANSLFIVSAVLPLTISLFFLLGVILLDDLSFRRWVIGMTGSAVLFLAVGMMTSHFEPTSYYGRPRILLGFVHPIVTASVILAAFCFALLQISTRQFLEKRQVRERRVLFGVCGTATLLLMLLAQSRNVLISLCLGLLCLWIGVHVSRKIRVLIFSGLLFLPIGIYLFVLTGSPLNPVWVLLNDLSSQRLALLQSVLASSVSFGDPQQLFEPSNARLTALAEYVGFASTDSVFQSFFFNYGLISVVCFVALLFTLGWKLAFRVETVYPYSALCGIVFFFSLDAQGVTTSNLILFVVFAYAVRATVSLQAALDRFSPS